MYCPNCRYEYESTATVCADCGAALEPGAPPVAPTPDPALLDYSQFHDWVNLTNVPNLYVGTVLKDQIEQAGVPVLMKRSRASDIGLLTHNDYVAHDLYVPRRYARRARRIVDSPASAGPYAGYGDSWDEVDEDEVEDTGTAGGDYVPAPASDPRSQWYLVDSGNPSLSSALPPTLTAPASDAPLPTLRGYQEALSRRKRRLAPAPRPEAPGPRVISLPTALPEAARYAPEPYEDEDWRAPAPRRWSDSPVYRILMGLLFLAWTLPFIVQLLQYMGEAWDRMFR
jgi:hypothetical protein